MDTIDQATALALFLLPRALGVTAEGEPVSTAIGRFGPYIKYGAKYVSLKDPDDPYTITHERALEVIAAKVIADANRLIRDFPEQGIQVLNGRYGPYITDKAKNARVPKDRDPKSLALDECVALLAAAPLKGTRGRFGRGKPAGKGAAAKGAVAKGADAKGKAAKAATPAAEGEAAAGAKAPAKAKAKAKAPAKAPAKAVGAVAAKPAKAKAAKAASVGKAKAPAKAKAAASAKAAAAAKPG